MRILTLCYEFPPIGGGGAKVASELARELVGDGHHVDLVTMSYRGLPKREVWEGVHVHRVPCVRRKAHYCTTPEAALYLIGAVPVVRKLIRANRYDVIHAHFIFPDGLLAWGAHRALGVPYVVTAHGSDVPGYNPDRLALAHKLLAPVWTRVTSGAQKVVCPSHSLRSLVLKQNSEVDTGVIPNGIDPGKFQPDRGKSKRILVSTRMLERKGVQYLLEALEGLDLDHEVHVVGDGPYLPKLRQLSDEKELPVTFRGWLDNQSTELRELHETSDIYVLPSESENFPIGLLEAMTAGMAIITTEDTGCAEVVGDAGLLVPAKDAEAIREALEGLTESPERTRQLGRAARRRLEERFTWQVVGQRYAALLKSVANGRGPGPDRTPA